MSVDWTYWPSDPVFLDGGFWDWRPPWVRPMRPGTMRWAMQQTVAPTLEPVTLAEVKASARVDITDDDDLINDLITTARVYIENLTGVSMMPQTWVMYLDRFPRDNAYETWPWHAYPRTILIPWYPVQSVSSITYLDSNGATQTIDPSTYTSDLVSRLARVSPGPAQSWPVNSPLIIPQQNSVQVTFVAGYPDQTTVPQTLKLAVKLLVGLWYQNREAALTSTRVASAVVPFGVKELLAQYMPPMVA